MEKKKLDGEAAKVNQNLRAVEHEPIKGKTRSPFQAELEKIVRSLNKHDLFRINGCLERAYAFVYALHSIAESDGLEQFGDHDAFIILDESVSELQEAMKLINKDVKKKVK